MVAFGGMGGTFGMPHFEFSNLTSGFSVNKIYIRDLYRMWYHGGLPGITDHIEGIAHYLARQIQLRDIKKTIMVGNSMGGYAALLLGWMLEAE